MVLMMMMLIILMMMMMMMLVGSGDSHIADDDDDGDDDTSAFPSQSAAHFLHCISKGTRRGRQRAKHVCRCVGESCESMHAKSRCKIRRQCCLVKYTYIYVVTCKPMGASLGTKMYIFLTYLRRFTVIDGNLW